MLKRPWQSQGLFCVRSRDFEICYPQARMQHMQNIDIVILAAGLGKRMQTELPKVLNELHGRPLISHVLDAVKASGVCDSPVIVVGKKREMVMDELGAGYRYAVQEEQLGTGHAVLAAKAALIGSTAPVMVLYGDMPYIKAETIRTIAETHAAAKATLTMATVTVPDFEGWRAGFYDFGRIIRDGDGHIVHTVEKKDATAEELLVMELNPCYFCFDSAWLWQHLEKLENTNAQGEYYLTDVVKMAVAEGVKISSVAIDPKEALGVNTKEHLELLHRV